jgi:hypothetical protein
MQKRWSLLQLQSVESDDRRMYAIAGALLNPSKALSFSALTLAERLGSGGAWNRFRLWSQTTGAKHKTAELPSIPPPFPKPLVLLVPPARSTLVSRPNALLASSFPSPLRRRDRPSPRVPSIPAPRLTQRSIPIRTAGWRYWLPRTSAPSTDPEPPAPLVTKAPPPLLRPNPFHPPI